MKCKLCAVEMQPGKAIRQTVASSPYIAPDIVAISLGGPGALVDCLKCPKCGWSVEKTDD